MKEVMKIPNIKCVCGKTIQARRQVKKGITTVTCRCGRSYRLCKAGKPIVVSKQKDWMVLDV